MNSVSRTLFLIRQPRLWLAVCVFSLLSLPAHATMQTVICLVYNIVVGDLGRAAATVGILTIGGGAALGKVSWGLAITVAIGIGILFGAVGIAASFGIISPC